MLFCALSLNRSIAAPPSQHVSDMASQRKLGLFPKCGIGLALLIVVILLLMGRI
jgi:hypothetical protein